MNLDANELILNDFADIWFTNCDARYRVLKGARQTGKSYNFIGYEPLFKILSDHRRNVMMVRQNDKDNSQSTYTQIKAAAYNLGIAHLFQFKKSPLSVIRKTTGQVILFAGMNDVQNITSTTVEHGYWTDIYFEEASQLKSYDDFLIVDGSLRIPEEVENDLYCQITLTMNAWDVGHWSYNIFYKDIMDDDVAILESEHYQYKYIPDFNIGYGFGLALHTSSYKCNTHITKSYLRSMEILKDKNYDYYKVVGLGCWGNTGDRTYPYWSDDLILPVSRTHGKRYNTVVIGIDFGMSNGEGRIKYSEENAKRLGSANTMQLVGVADNWDKVVCIDEYFDSNEGRSELTRKTAPQIQREMISTIKRWIDEYELYGTVSCYVDCADAGGFRDSLILEAEKQGLFNVEFKKSTKIPIISRVYFENFLMSYTLIQVGERCKNLIREIRNARKAKDGRCREDIDDHAINAFEYGWAAVRQNLKRWKTFKEPGGNNYDVEGMG